MEWGGGGVGVVVSSIPTFTSHNTTRKVNIFVKINNVP